METGAPPNSSNGGQIAHWPTPMAKTQNLAMENIESLQLFHLKGESADLYDPALGEGARTRANRYVRTDEGTKVAQRGGSCTITSAGAGMIKIIAFTDNPPPTVESGTFQEVLHEWGHTWIWEGLKLSGEGDDDTGAWLSTAIRDNTLVAV